MDTLIHADIFFFVTTIAVVIVTLLLAIALIYLIKVLNRIKNIAEQIREETVLFREDVHDLRDSVRREGFKLKNIADFAMGFFGRKKSKKADSK
jgi:hypothetical protein